MGIDMVLASSLLGISAVIWGVGAVFMYKGGEKGLSILYCAQPVLCIVTSILYFIGA